MSKIRIKNFGPIKEGCLEDDGFLDIKKVTIFIGNQGSGKSTVAKVISTMMWLEKAINKGDMIGLSNSIFHYHSRFQGISDYFKPNSEIDYWGEKYSLKFSEVEVIPEKNEVEYGKYITPKVMYIPAERNTLSSISNIKGMPDHLLTFYEELRRANKELKGKRLKLPINDYEYEYDEQSDSTFIIGFDYKIKILNASSGIQSFAPLYVVSKNLAQLVIDSDETIRKSMMSESILQMNEEMAALEVNDNLPENMKVIKRKEIKAKFLSKCFINIVEEPEQNLYPTSQRQILNSLLEFNNLSEGNKLIMTTHSPYIINYLSLAIQADYLKGKIHSDMLLEKLNSIVPLKSTISASDVAIYQLDERDGTIRKLSTFDGIPSDKNLLNQSLADGNELFDQLLEIEQEL
ncbi:MAG TPA: AAA family ATPase [Prolixibacteraceae bacterium]|nr:AAA family ATPase [Prolixibacteraceae bacterium]HPS12797.1 AAA family ATPase [Prolixibacteraceae bacterium]